MASHFDELETRAPQARERDLFARLPDFLRRASAAAPGLGRWLAGHDLSKVTSRAALAALPVLRKAELMEMQRAEPPFGGFADPAHVRGGRVFMSPGPIWEPQGLGVDPWQAARAFFAAGVALRGSSGFFTHPVAIGVILGLVLGKPIGITVTTLALTKLTGAELDPSIRMRELVGIGALAGVGFTVAMLVAELSFDEVALSDTARLAVMLGSVVSVAVSALFLVRPRRRRSEGKPTPAVELNH